MVGWWLSLPLWKMMEWKSLGMMKFIWKNNPNVPNHQPGSHGGGNGQKKSAWPLLSSALRFLSLALPTPFRAFSTVKGGSKAWFQNNRLFSRPSFSIILPDRIKKNDESKPQVTMFSCVQRKSQQSFSEMLTTFTTKFLRNIIHG